MNQQREFKTRDLVFSSMFAAMCVIATSIKVPFGMGAMVHLGSAFIYTIGIVFGGIYAGLAGAIGSAFYDILMGFSPYTLWSFVIKGIAGLIVGFVAKGMWPEAIVKPSTIFMQHKFLRAVLGCVLAAAWTLGGYMVAWWQVTGSWDIAVANMPSSLMTSSAGLIIALLIAPKLRNVLKR